MSSLEWREIPSNYVSHTKITELFGDTDLPEDAITRHQEAYFLVDQLDDPTIVGVNPTSLASAYSVKSGPPTLIEIEALPASIQNRTSEVLGLPADNLYILFGTGRTYDDHSLTEFSSDQ